MEEVFMVYIIAVIMVFSIPIIAILTSHSQKQNSIKLEMIESELKLEKLKQENYLLETEKMRMELELEKIKLEDYQNHTKLLK
jgi:hypothetical protein